MGYGFFKRWCQKTGKNMPLRGRVGGKVGKRLHADVTQTHFDHVGAASAATDVRQTLRWWLPGRD